MPPQPSMSAFRDKSDVKFDAAMSASDPKRTFRMGYSPPNKSRHLFDLYQNWSRPFRL